MVRHCSTSCRQVAIATISSGRCTHCPVQALVLFRRYRSGVVLDRMNPSRSSRERSMPRKQTIRKARQDKREGKSPSTQAGEFVHEEIDKIRRGKHGARSTKQAVAIGLSEARRAGVDLPPPRKGRVKQSTRRSAEYAYEAGQGKRKTRRRPRGTVSRRALSRQAKRAAARRSAESRSAAARKASRTKGAKARSAAAKKAARTRARRRR